MLSKPSRTDDLCQAMGVVAFPFLPEKSLCSGGTDDPLCLAKIKSAFEINQMQRGRATRYTDEIQLLWSFGEGYR